MGSGNWIVDNLNSALATWNDKLTEIWTLISTSPEEFKGGGIWDVILNIHDALRAIGYALLVLFFVAGVVKTCGSFTELKRPEMAVKTFVRFALAQGAVTYGLELMMALFSIAQGAVSTIMDASGLTVMSDTALPDEMVTIIEDVGFLEQHPAVGGDAPGIPVYLGPLAGDDPHRVFPLFQTLYGDGHRAHPTGQFRGTALQQHRRGFYQELCRHLSGGLYDRFGLYYLFPSLPRRRRPSRMTQWLPLPSFGTTSGS